MKKTTQKNNQDKLELEKILLKSNDFENLSFTNEKTKIKFCFTYMSTLIDEKILQDNVLPALLKEEFQQLDDVKEIIPISDVQISDNASDIEQKLFNGYVLLTIIGEYNKYCFFAAQKEVGRTINPPEVEFSVIGPKEAFVESLDMNLNLVRKKLPIKELIIEELSVGALSKTKIAIIYIDNVVNTENVNTIRQRLEGIQYDDIADSSYIVQMVSDNHNSPFPQLLDTERPDRVSSSLAEGKVVVIVDGSPHALIGPTTFVEFFSSFEDYFLNWLIASFFRLIRLFSVAFSILVTPIYVAVLSYHYELIPRDLLNALVASRRAVPLPPILEALFLELTIELLREAGARLPTKVGQTIGIVGGIVIGTASVEAGLTSNVLLILIALAALASFTTPVYRMGNTIRFLRFPFLLFAELWGLLGIVLAFCFLLVHLIRLTSLGRPYLEPVYPLRKVDFKDSFIRLSFSSQGHRPLLLRSKRPKRVDESDAKKKKDIDE